MAELRPFRPLRYNPKLIGDLSAVVAPPYDVISPARRDALYERSPYNAVRLILNRSDDPYGAAAELLAAWRRSGVLVRDPRAALCYHVERFTLPTGQTYERQGVLGIVRLEPFHTGRIRPHERTFARHREDRMRILRACRTNLSPIFGLFADRMDALDPARAVAADRAPDVAIEDDTGVRHRVWFVTDAAAIRAVGRALVEETIFIADGHHRYETALAYADEHRREHGPADDAPHNFVLMYLTSMNDPGLVILPTHRLLSGVPGLHGPRVGEQLRRYFRVTPFPRTARDDFYAHLHESAEEVRLGVAFADSPELLVLAVEDFARLERFEADLAPAVRRLDVAVLDAVVLRGMLGIACAAATEAGQLTYTHDDAKALDAVTRGAQAAFLMNPPHIENVQAVCLAGETMPEKSTYFYPKLLTGLVFHPLDDTDHAP
jgi:uncharacterized protein (DUF1015 family)